MGAEKPSGLINFSPARDHIEILPSYEVDLQILPRPFSPDSGGDITLTISDVDRRYSSNNTDTIMIRLISPRGDLGYKAMAVSGTRKDGRPNILGLIDVMRAAGASVYDILSLTTDEVGVPFETVKKYLIGKRLGAKVEVRTFSFTEGGGEGRCPAMDIVRFYRAEWLKNLELQSVADEARNSERSAVVAFLVERGMMDLARRIHNGAHVPDEVPAEGSPVYAAAKSV